MLAVLRQKGTQMRNGNLDGHGGFKVADARGTHDFPLVERCRPALTVLERYGVTYISLVMRFENGGEVETYAREPRFSDHLRIPKKSCELVWVAWTDVLIAIEDAVRQVISGTDYEDSNFLVSVAMRRSEQPEGWSVGFCEITAILDILDPSEVIKLP